MRRYGAGRFAAALPLAHGSPLRAALPLTLGFPLRAVLPLAPGSPLQCGALAPLGSPLRCGFPFCGALARARFAALRLRRSRSRSVRRFGRRSRSRPAFRFAAVFSVAVLPLTPGSPRCCGAPAPHGRILPHKHIFKHNYKPKPQAQRSFGFPHSKKYAPFGGVFPLSDIYFCFAYSAIALYFSKSSGRRMRALAGLVEGSSMHGMQPQGSQNRL